MTIDLESRTGFIKYGLLTSDPSRPATESRARLRNVIKRLLVVFMLLLSPAFAFEELWDTPSGRERVFNALIDIFEDNYWDAQYRDWDAWGEPYRELAVNAGSRLEFDSALRRMVSELGDDHSRWVGLASLGGPASSNPAAEPALGVRQTYLQGEGLVVERVFPNTPAESAGLKRGDVIVRVGTTDLRDVQGGYEVSAVLTDAVKSGDVRLSVRRKAHILNILVQPERVDFRAAEEAPQAEMLDASTGYLYLPSFQGEGVAAQVHGLISDLQNEGMTALVLDLRGNPGGRLGELGLVLGAFFEADGTWVEAVKGEDVTWRAAYFQETARNILETPGGEAFAENSLLEPARFTGPLAVLVTERNSSAGEVAALVLQDLGRATVVGEPTLGNVEAVQAFDLPDGSLVYVAVANLRGVGGADYSLGVTPDIEVTSSLQELARGFDAPVAEALRALKELPFTPGRFF